jgi:hypothetical protein
VEGAWSEYIVNQRLAIEKGEYLRVPALSPDMPVETLAQDFGYRYSLTGRNQAPEQPESVDEVAKYQTVEPTWHPPESQS